MLTWPVAGVQWDRVIVLREQARSHRGSHSKCGSGLAREWAGPLTTNPPTHHLPLWIMTSTRTRHMLDVTRAQSGEAEITLAFRTCQVTLTV
ncbi:hypothetical protein D3C75_784310 [compost metagenome]